MEKFEIDQLYLSFLDLVQLRVAKAFISHRWQDRAFPKDCFPVSIASHLAVVVRTKGMRMSRTVAQMIVETLEQVGVRQIFGLIGDSLNPLGDAVRRSNIEWIGVRHEEGAALAAAGQAQLTGRLAVCAGTTGPGSNHLVAGLYEANRSHAPVLALSGEMSRRTKGIEFVQSTEPDLLFRDVSLYTQTISSAAQAAGAVQQAIATAYAGPGVAHLTLPQDVLSEAAHGEPMSLATLRPRNEVSPLEAEVDELARRINEAHSVLAMCGFGCHGAADLVRQLSDRLKAPLVHTMRGKDILPYDDPRWMGTWHDRHPTSLQRCAARRSASDAGYGLSLFKLPARSR